MLGKNISQMLPQKSSFQMASNHQLVKKGELQNMKYLTTW